MKKLPVKFDVALTTDCRIQQRLAIIEMSKYGKEWLFTHLNSFMSDKLGIYYGNNTTAAGMNYFDDILLSKEIILWEIEDTNIINVIQNCIDKDEYVILDVYFGNENETMANKTFSTLIYGYDENKQEIYTVWLENGQFCEKIRTFSELVSYYSAMYKEYSVDVMTKVSRMYFNYSITSLKIREDYCPNNAYLLALIKIEKEEQGLSCENKVYDVLLEHRHTIFQYTGVNSYLGICDKIQNMINSNLIDNSIVYQLYRTLFSFIENKKILLATMEWIHSYVNLEETYMAVIRDMYEDVIRGIKSMYFLCGKYIYTNDVKYLRKLITLIPDIYKKDKMALAGFRSNASNKYAEKISYESYIKNNG